MDWAGEVIKKKVKKCREGAISTNWGKTARPKLAKDRGIRKESCRKARKHKKKKKWEEIVFGYAPCDCGKKSTRRGHYFPGRGLGKVKNWGGARATLERASKVQREGKTRFF